MRLLLQRGANVLAKTRKGVSVLHSIVAETDFRCWSETDTPAEAADMVLGAGERVDVQDSEGRTVLHYAIQNVDFTEYAVYTFDLVRLLLGRGAMVKLEDKSGITPLQLAQQSRTGGWLSVEEGSIKAVLLSRRLTEWVVPRRQLPTSLPEVSRQQRRITEWVKKPGRGAEKRKRGE